MEQSCKTCRWCKPYYQINPETKEVNEEPYCTLVSQLMKNYKPCRLYAETYEVSV